MRFADARGDARLGNAPMKSARRSDSTLAASSTARAADPLRAPRAPLIAPPGLEGVVVADTQIGDVRGDEGFYHYRQYDAIELAAKRTLEDVWHLLYEGTLPDSGEGAAFSARIRSMRVLPASLHPALHAITAIGPPVTPWSAPWPPCRVPFTVGRRAAAWACWTLSAPRTRLTPGFGAPFRPASD